MKLIKKIKCKVFGHPLFANPLSCPFTGRTYVYCVDCGERKDLDKENTNEE